MWPTRLCEINLRWGHRSVKVFITGATGFVGSHLIDFLLRMDGVQIFAARRRRSDMSLVEQVGSRVNWVEMDVTDAHSVLTAIRDVEPDRIFHLAAQSFVPTSWKALQETVMTNVIGTVNLLEACRTIGLGARIHVAGSSEEYGLVRPEEVPITERNPLRPLSPYGVSKVAADLLGQQYYHSYGLAVVVTRAFNHTGPRRGEVFVSSNFAKQIAEIEAGLREPTIRVGNLESKRDFTDVRDIVRAYWLALDRGRPGHVYNVCSGNAMTIRELLEILIDLSRVTEIRVECDPQRMRPSDVPLLQGDYSLFHEETGWRPEIPLRKTLEDLLNYWRERTAKS